MNNSDSIRNLLINISQGDTYSFRLFYDRFFKLVLQFSHYFLKSDAVCEEIVSDVFISIWLNREKLATVDNIENYLFIITRNKSLNQQEKEASANVWTTESEPENRIENSNPESLLISKELETAITSSIDQLPEKCRIIFQMSRYHKLKHHQIAKILSISENTVHAQMMIAINKLHQMLKKFICLF